MTGTLRVTLLGSGSSGGVPRSTGDWGACDPQEVKNRRTRGGLLLEKWKGAVGKRCDATVALVDTSPDLRQQLSRDPPDHLDAVLFSHDHADQTHGIDDLRAYYFKARRALSAYMDELTRALLETRFAYCFKDCAAFPAVLKVAGELHPFEEVVVEGAGGPLVVTPLLQDHGFGAASLGFRVGAFAYSNDVVSFPARSYRALRGLDAWIVDALREEPHPLHAHIGLALDWIADLKPKHAVLTNLNHDVDYQTLKARLPAGIEPAYDGWRMEIAL